MTDLKRNSYEDADFLQLIGEIEEFEDQKASIMAEAAGKRSGIAKKVATAKKSAKDRGIPMAILLGALKTRKLERKLQEIAEDIPDDLAELWVEASGQISMFRPAEDAPKGEPLVTTAARSRKAAADAHQEQEQKEGAAVLGVLTGGKPN